MAAMLLILLAQAAAPAPSAPTHLPNPSTEVTLFSTDDYPPEAYQKGQQGTVVTDVVVTREGRVGSCRIVQSSGHDLLDRKTCDVLVTRARFSPAKDFAGKPVEQTLRMPPITWRMQQVESPASGSTTQAARPRAIFSFHDYPAEALRNGWEGTVIAELTINEEGWPMVCLVVKSSGYKVLDDTTCRLLLRRAKFTPARDEDGRPVSDTVRTPPIEWRIP